MIFVFRLHHAGLAALDSNTGNTIMIEEESNTANPAALPASHPLAGANDDRTNARSTMDPRILVIARAIGRQIAHEQIQQHQSANDNMPRDD
jgi:hypothetical protein